MGNKSGVLVNWRILWRTSYCTERWTQRFQENPVLNQQVLQEGMKLYLNNLTKSAGLNILVKGQFKRSMNGCIVHNINTGTNFSKTSTTSLHEICYRYTRKISIKSKYGLLVHHLSWPCGFRIHLGQNYWSKIS